MPVYEYQMGIFVQADNEDEAWEKLNQKLMPLMEKLDYEGNPSCEQVAVYKESDL